MQRILCLPYPLIYSLARHSNIVFLMGAAICIQKALEASRSSLRAHRCNYMCGAVYGYLVWMSMDAALCSITNTCDDCNLRLHMWVKASAHWGFRWGHIFRVRVKKVQFGFLIEGFNHALISFNLFFSTNLLFIYSIYWEFKFNLVFIPQCQCLR